MTDDRRIGIISIRSTEGRSNETIAYRLLKPLRQGKPVVLVVDDPRMPKRKRVAKPFLFLTPMTMYGVPSPKILASFQAHGCEIIDTRERITSIMFYRMGLNIRLATALSEVLNQVFRNVP